MYFVQHDGQGQVIRMEQQPFYEMTGKYEDNSPEVLAWLQQNTAREESLKRLQHSDLEMVRVLEDLITVLMDKGVLTITDLPPAAQNKLMHRTQARQALGGLEKPINDDDDALI